MRFLRNDMLRWLNYRILRRHIFERAFRNGGNILRGASRSFSDEVSPRGSSAHSPQDENERYL